MESNYPEKNHIEFKLPNKIKEDYLNSGILSVGEGHGIKEYYEFYEKLITSLIYLDENLNSNSDRDVQMANQFIKNFKKPAVIISGIFTQDPTL